MADAEKKSEPEKKDEKSADGSSVPEDPVAAATAYALIKQARPGEPPFQLKLEPDDFVIFKSDNLTGEHVGVDVKITNTASKRQTYKVKCTSNQIFRVRPPLAYLAPGETVVIKFSCVTSTLPDAYRHFFAFYHMASEDKRNARFAWTGAYKPEGVLRVPVKFQKMDGTPYPVPAGSAPIAPPPAPPVDKPEKSAAPEKLPPAADKPSTPEKK